MKFKKIFGDWRELIREFTIIVLGVLTALFAQQAVESLNWRQKVNSAIADMDQEMSSGNGPQSYVRLSIHQCLAGRLQNLRSLTEAGDRTAVSRAIDAIQLPLRNYNSRAREAANAADITAHMPANRKYDYRILYALTPEMDSIHRKELEDLASLRSLPTTGGSLNQDEKRVVLGAVENLLIDNDRIKRAAIFTLGRTQDLGIKLDKPQVQRNFADVPTYQNCLTRDVGSMLTLAPVNAGGRSR